MIKQIFILWPYDKPKTEKRPTQCPKWAKPSLGNYEDEILVMIEYCNICKNALEKTSEEKGD